MSINQVVSLFLSTMDAMGILTIVKGFVVVIAAFGVVKYIFGRA